MPDTKISLLPAKTSLTGGEELPINDAGTNKKVAVSTFDGRYAALGAASTIGPPCFFVASSTANATVKARADYICTGTSDQVKINAALLLGSVVLSDGNFTIDAPIAVTKPGTSFSGQGFGEDMGANGGRGWGTLILVAATFTGGDAVLVDQSPSYVNGQVSLHSFKIDGTSGPASVNGVRMRSYQFTMHDISVRNMTGNGFVIQGYTAAEIPSNGWDTYDGRFYSLHSRLATGAGLLLANNTGDLHGWGCVFHNNNYGVRRSGGSSGQFFGFHCYSNTLYGYWADTAGSRDKLIGWKIEHSGSHGIYLDGTTTGTAAIQIVGCGFNCNGQTTNNTADHISVSGPQQATRLQIIGCTFGNSDNVANLARYAINLSSYGVGTVIQGCYFGPTLATAGVATGRLTWGGTNVKPALTVSGNYGVRDIHGSPAPTAVAGAGAGTTPPAPVVDTTATDMKGFITSGTGTTPAAGDQYTVTFSLPFEAVGARVMVTAMNAATAVLDPYVSAVAVGTFTVAFAAAPAASQANTVYSVAYAVVG